MRLQEAKENVPIEFSSDEKSRLIWDEICESSPSDHIYLSHEEDIALCSLWQKEATKTEFTPADIFFAGTVPLLDCIITVNESNCILQNGMNGRIVEMRFVIFKDYKERISKGNSDGLEVGFMIQTIEGRSILYPLCVKEGFNHIFTSLPSAHNLTYHMKERYKSIVSQAEVCMEMQEWLDTWYGLQIALLHPMVKTIFEHPTMERIYNPSSFKKKNKRITCYIKKHVIKPGDIESALDSGERNYTRKTLVWYVIGHWRRYQDGRSIFIKPYWKGPLRELQRNIDGGRDRKIALEESE